MILGLLPLGAEVFPVLNHVFLNHLQRTSAPSGGLFQLGNILTSFWLLHCILGKTHKLKIPQILFQDDSYLVSAKERPFLRMEGKREKSIMI